MNDDLGFVPDAPDDELGFVADAPEQAQEKPGFFSQVGTQLLSQDATQLAEAYANEINDLRNYDALPWYKRAKYPSDPAEREARVGELLPELERWSGNVAQYESERPAPTPEQQRIAQAPTLGAALGEAVDNPGAALGLIGPSAAASLVQAPQIVAAGLAAGPRGAALASGGMAAEQDYYGSLLSQLGDMGYDVSDNEILAQALQQADVLTKAQEAAGKRAAVVGATAGLGTAVGGKMLGGFMAPGVGREVANVAAQVPVQAGVDMAGEALAQQASGEGYKPGEVVLEGLGGAVTAPVDVAQAAAAGFKEQGKPAAASPADAATRNAYIASLSEVDDGEGGRVLVDAQGTPVGATLDEAKAAVAALTPEDIAGRMAPAAPAENVAPQQDAIDPEVAEVAPEPGETLAPAAQDATPAVDPNAAFANDVPASASEQPITAETETPNAPSTSPLLRGKARDAAAQTSETQSEQAPARGEPAAPVAAGRPGGAARFPDGSTGTQGAESVGSGTDIGRVQGERDASGGTVGEAPAGRDEAPAMATGRESDAALKPKTLARGGDYDRNAGKPIHEMSLTELRARREAVKKDIADTEQELLGDKADAYRKALRKALSENDERAAKGQAELEALGITPEVDDALQGEGLPDMAWDEAEDFIAAAEIAALAETPEQAAQGMWRDMLAVGRAPKTDPSEWSRSERIGYTGLKALAERIKEKGWDAQQIQKRAIGMLRGQIEDADVEFMLDRFLPKAPPAQPQRSPLLRGKQDAIQNVERQPPSENVNASAPAGQDSVGGDVAQAPAEGAAQGQVEKPDAPLSLLQQRIADAKDGAFVPDGGNVTASVLAATGEDAPAAAYADGRLTGYAADAVEAMARLFGKKVVVFRETGKRKRDGFVAPQSPGVIFLNADSTRPHVAVFMHEMLHSLKRTDAKTYAKLEKALAPLLKDHARFKEARMGGKGSDALVQEEMMADVMGDQASDPKFWADLYGRFGDKSAWGQLVAYMRQMLSNVIDSLYPLGSYQYVTDFNKAYEAVVDAAYNHARAQHGDGAAEGAALESRAQEQTSEFKKWFGGSKVVDENGEPLVVYHGTTADVTAFDPAKRGSDTKTKSAEKGFYFTSSPRHASVYADGVTNTMRNQTRDGANVVPVYVQMQNPKIIKTRRPVEMEVDVDDGQTVQNAIDDGYDGIIVSREVGDEYDGKLVIAFRPNQIKSAIGNNGAFSPDSDNILELPILSTSQGSPPSQSVLDEGNAAWRAGAVMWDNMNRMRIAQDKLVERGLKLRDDMNVWVRENLARSKMRVMADKVSDDYQTPILKAMKKADLTLKQVDDFLYAKHAPERNAAIAAINPKFPDGGSGMKNAEAARILAGFTLEQTRALDGIAKLVYDMQAYKLDVMEKNGLTEPSEIQSLKAKYQNYVPLKTIEDDAVSSAPGGTGKGIEVSRSEYKAALGRGSRATSPLMVSFQDMARVLVRAHKNEAGNALLALARDPLTATMLDVKSGKPIIGIADPTDYARPVTDSKGNVSIAVPSNWWQNEEVFITKEGGVQRYIAVRDPELMAQLRRMGDADIGAILQGIGGATRLFARMLTQYNPVFAPVNLIRDTIQASILALGADINPVKVMASVPANMGRILKHRISANTRYAEFLEDGGSTNAYGLRDLDDALAEVESVGIDLGYVPPRPLSPMQKGWRGTKKLTRKAWRRSGAESVFEALAWYNEAFENAVRLSTYNAMRDKGVSREQAAFQSKELSTNFNKKGQWSSAMNAAYVFVNAAMQGNRALLKFSKSPKVKAALIGLIAAGVLQDLLGAAMGGDDDESGLKNIDEVGDWALDHNIILITGEDTQKKIPLPYGLNLPFAIGRRVSKAIRTGDGFTQLTGILNVMLDNFSPIGGVEAVVDQKTGKTNVSATIVKTATPSLVRPLVSVATNSNFMGAPIARTPFQGDQTPAPRAYDAKPGTADYAIELAKVLNSMSGGDSVKPGDIDISPEHVEFLLGEYTGGAGRFVSDSVSIGTKLTTGKAADIDWEKAPFIRSFSGTDSRSDAYARFRTISTDAKYTKDQMEAREPVKPLDRGMLPVVEQADKRLKALRKERKAAYAREDMKRVREIQDQEQAVIKGVVKTYEARSK